MNTNWIRNVCYWPRKVTREILPETRDPQFRQWVTSGITKLDTAGSTWGSITKATWRRKFEKQVTKSADSRVARSWADYLHTAEIAVFSPSWLSAAWEPLDDHRGPWALPSSFFLSTCWRSPRRLTFTIVNSLVCKIRPAAFLPCHWIAIDFCWTWQTTKRRETRPCSFGWDYGFILWN